MDSAWTSIIVFVLSVFVLIFFVGQAFFAGGEKVTTETAFTYSMTEDIPFEGVFLRDETVIHNSGTGVVDYEHSDGSKVGKSSVIARRYRSEADIERRSEIEKINEQIAVLTDAQRLAGTDNNQLETISSQINERHSLILENLIYGDYSSAQAQENAMLGVLSKREISRGDIASYESKISSLRSRASQLEAMLSGDVQDIEAGGAGYFVSSVDGYEDKLSTEDSTTITADRIEEILDKPDLGSSSSEVGKLIADYRWRVAAVMDSSQLFGCNEGGEVTLRVSSDPTPISAEVVSITDSGRGDGTAVYVFECDTPGVDLVLVALVEQGAGGLIVCDISDVLNDSLVHFSELRGYSRVADNFACAVDEPGSLDVVAVGVDIADNVHVSVEEYQELMTFLVVDLVVCKVQLELEAVENLRAVVCEVQLGVSFHQVEGGVHGLVSHQTVLGKLVVLELALPVARHCFEVSKPSRACQRSR